MLGNRSLTIFYSFLEEALTFQEQIIDEIPDLVFLTDRNSRIIKCNRLWGNKFSPSSSPTGKHVREALTATLATHFEKVIEYSGLQYHVELIDQILWKSTLIQQRAWLHIGTDMAMVRQIYEKNLAEASRRESITQFATGLAHEFNNPLAVAQLAIAQLSEHAKSHSPQYLRIATAATNALHRLARIVEVFRQVGSEAAKADIEILDLNAVIKEACDLTRAVLNHHEISLTTQLAESLPRLAMRRSMVLDAIMQLLQNAMEALRPVTQRKRLITVTSALGDRHVTFTVQDNGTGITSGNLGRIFDPFFTTKEINLGRGLGLCIVHQAFKEMGGSVVVQSQEDAYTKFVVTIPVEAKGVSHERHT